ncbi:MAG: glutaredoxin [Ruminococcaceae bacterium]|nr:glutaredoxin [Oscillospiraceae bacterium]
MLILGGKWTSREKKLTILHLDNCPYCHKARRALDELCEKNPAYRGVAVEWIEEERESEAASRYTDYYYVPTIYAGGEKLFEAHPGDDYETIKENVKHALDAVVVS